MSMMCGSELKPEEFWQIRAAKYDLLYWTKHEGYTNEILRLGDLKTDHLVLDVGTGTGTVARLLRGLVRHVVAMDISGAMLGEGDWDGISVLRWNIGDSFFANAVFDRVFARMVFHHILDNLPQAIIRCYDLLKKGGKIVIAEGLPPTDDDVVVDWFDQMFKLKEERRVFIPGTLIRHLRTGGFRNIACNIYYMDNFSVANWLDNCGLDQQTHDEIMKLHREAPRSIKDVYQMRITDDDCVIRTRHAIIVAEK